MHNRFYVPLEAQFLQFDYNMLVIEYALDGNGLPTIPRQPHVNVFLRVDGEEHFLGKADLAIPSSPRGEADFIASSQVPLAVEWRGKVGELILRVSISPTEPALAPGSTALTRVWIDNVRLGPSGAPMQTESPTQVSQVVSTLTVGDLTSLIDVSRAGWRSLVDVPDGIGGITSRYVGVAAPDFSLPDGADRQARNTGIGQGGLDNQSFFVNLNIASVQSILNDQEARNVRVSLLGSVAFTDQLGMNSDSSFATNGHAVEAQNESDLFWEGEGASLSQVIVNHDGALHSSISEDGATINQSVIDGATHFDIRGDLAPQGGNGAGTDLDVLNLEKVPLESLKLDSSFGREGVGLIESNLFFNPALTARVDEYQRYYEQYAFDHTPSFGTPTLSPDRSLVNRSAENGLFGLSGSWASPVPNNSQLITHNSTLSPEQLDLLSRTTVTIADLADGYLALTLGTTITLDTDAAGFGWFIDPTPWASEEFVPGSLTVKGYSLIESDSSQTVHGSRFTSAGETPWQLIAKADGPASGKIDLMTVLMHELGHVMGLGHVSSAVDGTRLMAGSIDPGIRRLPSSLDVGLSGLFGLSGSGASSDP
ncbi:MAG: hypothetical protein OEV08_16100, partial [Nitrospira sp.]|nr:hypothetical protein [Nitrospira sp.]